MRPPIRVTFTNSRRLKWMSSIQETYIGGQATLMSHQYGYRIKTFRIPVHSQHNVLRPILTIEVDLPPELLSVSKDISKAYAEERLKDFVTHITRMFQGYVVEHPESVEFIYNGLFVDVENGKLNVSAKQEIIDLLGWGDKYLTMVVKTDYHGKLITTFGVFEAWTDVLVNPHFLEKIKNGYGKGVNRAT